MKKPKDQLTHAAIIAFAISVLLATVAIAFISWALYEVFAAVKSIK